MICKVKDSGWQRSACLGTLGSWLNAHSWARTREYECESVGLGFGPRICVLSKQPSVSDGVVCSPQDSGGGGCPRSELDPG